MKKTILIALCTLFAVNLNAQQTNTDEIALIQSAYGMEKKQIIVQFMKLTEAENAVFWKIYDEYEAERKELGKKRANNIIEYANNYGKLTDAKAAELINSSLDVQMNLSKLLKKTYAKLGKVMSPIRAAQFIQLENYLETMVRMEISDEIPLIGELEAAEKK
jgi:Spy/CpxP family protein refolding chaperone